MVETNNVDSIFADSKEFNELKAKYLGFNLEKYIKQKINYFNKNPFKQRYYPLWIQEIGETLTLVNENYTDSLEIKNYNDAKTFSNPKLNGKTIIELAREYGINVKNGMAICPFHKDTDPSLSLSEEKGLFNCFGCGTKGNVWTFKKKMDELIGDKEQIKQIFTLEGQTNKFNEIQPIFFDRSGMFWLWNNKDKFWEMVDEVDILNMIGDSTGKDIISSKSRTEIINALKQKGRLNIPKPIKTSWIQFKNKIYDIENGKSFEATPEYFVTNPIPWEVSGNPQTPHIEKIFEEWVGKEHVQTLYEILAFCLVPDYPINRLFCFIGGGMNGKSCFLNLLKKFIGNKNVCSTELDTLITSRFEVTRLHKKLVCLMGETNFNEMSKTSIIKKLTGRDTIGFEYKNKTPFEDINYAKIIIATNNLPTTTDKTIGFYRRWSIIDFPNQFSEKKDILAEIPEEEYNNLATNSIIILNELLKKREFTNEGTIEERTEKYESKSNFLDKFIEISIKEDFSEFITVSDFNKKFSAWCKENKHRELSETTIGMTMKKKGYEQEKRFFNWMYDGKGGQARVWTGIKWK